MKKSEPFRFLRLIFVIASLSPLFIIWGLKGFKQIPDYFLVPAVILVLILSNGIVLYRWAIVKKQNLTVQAQVQDATDHREHLVVYLLAVLLAMFGANAADMRELSALFFALFLIVILFWYSNLHYLNVAFALFGFKTFTATRKVEGNNSISTLKVVVLTRRSWIEDGESIICYRLSHDIWVEK